MRQTKRVSLLKNTFRQLLKRAMYPQFHCRVGNYESTWSRVYSHDRKDTVVFPFTSKCVSRMLTIAAPADGIKRKSDGEGENWYC